MKLELTEDQEREVAISWIKSCQSKQDGYKPVMDILLSNAHFASWSWLDAIIYAVTICSRMYSINRKQIVHGILIHNKETP